MTRLLPLVLLAACGWDLPHQHGASLDAPLWDATTAVPTTDGLYISLPRAGGLALVRADGTASRVDIGAARLAALSPAPDAASVLGFVERTRCELDGPRDARGVEVVRDCPLDKRAVSVDAVRIADGVVTDRFELPSQFHTVTWSSDGATAVALVDPARAAEVKGVVNLNAVLVLDLANGIATSVPVGFAANRVLFTADGGRAVVLSQSAVAVIDLTADTPYTDITFPLTLDPDDVVTPVGVALTPDGAHALISVAGSADLYALDLENPSVNIVSLSGAPSAMAVDGTTDKTVLALGTRNAVDIVEHEYFDVTTIQLDEPTNHITQGDGFVLLSRLGSGRDVYALHLAAYDLAEFRLQAPALSVYLEPGERYAVALTTESGLGARPGMEVLDLVNEKTYPYLLEGRGLGVAFSEVEEAGVVTALNALVLQSGVDYVYQLDLLSGQPAEIELSRPPARIGALPDGTFFVTHAAELGLVSFLDPVSGSIVEASGFGAFGLLDDVPLDAVEVN